MRPAHLLLAAAGLALFGLAGTGLAIGITWLRIDLIEEKIGTEFAQLHGSGAIARPPEVESAELGAARAQLARLLMEVTPERAEPLLFGTPDMIRSVSVEELGRGLARRAAWYSALDALPQALWSAVGEPRPLEGSERSGDEARRPSDSLAGLRAATNHLCAMAWYVANDPQRAAQAGHWLARGIALARATDNGSRLDLVLRVELEQIVLDRAERIAALEGVDRERLLHDLQRELARGDERDRLTRAVESDLRWLEYHFEVYRSRETGSERLTQQRHILEQVREWRALLASDLQARLPELAARLEDRSLPGELRLDHMVFASWFKRGLLVEQILAGA